MLNVRQNIVTFMLKIRDSLASGWFTKMTKQIASDLIDDKPRRTVFAQRLCGPQLKTFRVEPIAVGRVETLALKMGGPQPKTFRVKPTVVGWLTDMRKRTARNMVHVRPSKLMLVLEQNRQLPKRARSEPTAAGMRTETRV